MRVALSLALLLFSTSASAVSPAASWTYFDIKEPKNQFLLQQSPDSSAWIHLVGPAEFCPRTGPFLCFKAGEFQFAVPRGFAGKETEWTYDGVRYSVSGTGHRVVLGRKYLFYFIERDLGEHRLQFLFTREAGLIGIATIGKSHGMMLISSEKCGFGAPASCHRTR